MFGSNNKICNIHKFYRTCQSDSSTEGQTPKNVFKFYILLEKLPPYVRLFSSSCGGLQPLAANGGDLWTHFFRDFPADFFREHFFRENLFREFFFWEHFFGNFFWGNFFGKLFSGIFFSRKFFSGKICFDKFFRDFFYFLPKSTKKD